MKCLHIETGRDESRRNLYCRRCGKTMRVPFTSGDNIHSSCQAWPFAWELGHWAAIFLAAAGITKGRWNWLRARLGLVKPCKCGERQEAINTWGARLAARLVALRKRLWGISDA